jgi:hypothetical protein
LLFFSFRHNPKQIKNEEWRLFQNFSFGTATLDLREKAGFRPLFPGACGKTMGFWNSLNE